MAGPSKRLKYDFVVCGGGLAGVCAAVAAAREGLKTALVQERPVLGGCSSSEIRVDIHGAGTYWPWLVETGVIAEMADEERFRNPEEVFEGHTSSAWDHLLYEWCVREKNLDLHLSTVAHAVKTRKGLIRSVTCLQLGSEASFELFAPLFLDATGDGAIAALAGASFRYGRESKKEFNEPYAPGRADQAVMGSSILFRARDMGRPVPFHAPDWAVKYPTEDSIFWRFHNDPRGGYWWIEVGVPFHTITEDPKIRHELLRQVLGVFDHMKNCPECPAYEKARNLALDWVGAVPGKRESRRIEGLVMLTENDLRGRRRFEDDVAYGGWHLDDHVPGGVLAMDKRPEATAYDPDAKDKTLVGPYSIPLRALICRDVKNLLLAGRDISATHVAMSSTRVMSTCAVMGQAAAAAAVICGRRRVLPGKLGAGHVKAVQQLLLRQDCYVPGVPNLDSGDLALTARAAASSAGALLLEPGDGWLELDFSRMQVLPLTAAKIDRVELFLENRTKAVKKLSLSLYRRADIWDNAGPQGTAVSCALIRPGKGRWLAFELGRPVSPGCYGIALNNCPGVFWRCAAPIPPGTAALSFRKSGLWRFEGWRGRWMAQAVRVRPESRPFEAGNVINGVSRPEALPNLWMSDPSKKLPQTLTLKLKRPSRVSEIRITFDNNLGRGVRNTPPLFVAPELARDYDVDALVRGRWKGLVSVKGNRARHRVHAFSPVRAEAVRLRILATNGAPEARVYEVRLYQRSRHA